MSNAPSPTKRRFFAKEVVSSPLWATKGWVIPFEDIGDDTGLLITEHPGLIAELEKAILQHRGGVYEITEADIEPLKKKSSSEQTRRNALSNNVSQRLRLEATHPSRQGKPAEPAAEGEPAPAAPPLDPVPTLDPSLLRPKPTKKKSALSSTAQAPPSTTQTVLPP